MAVVDVWAALVEEVGDRQDRHWGELDGVDFCGVG